MFLKNISEEKIFFSSNGIELRPGSLLKLDRSFDKGQIFSLLEDDRAILQKKKNIKDERTYSFGDVEHILTPLAVRGDASTFVGGLVSFGKSDLESFLMANTLKCLDSYNVPMKGRYGFSESCFDVATRPTPVWRVENVDITNSGIGLCIDSFKKRRFLGYPVPSRWKVTKGSHEVKELDDNRVLYRSVKASDGLSVLCKSMRENWRGIQYIIVDVELFKAARMLLSVNGCQFMYQFVDKGRHQLRFDVSGLILSKVRSCEFSFFRERGALGDVIVGEAYGEKGIKYKQSGCFYTTPNEALFLEEIWFQYYCKDVGGGVEVYLSLDSGETFQELKAFDIGHWQSIQNVQLENKNSIVYKLVLNSSNNREMTPRVTRFFSMARG